MNMAALEERSRRLGERLRWPMGSDHVVRQPNGHIHLKLGMQSLPLQLDSDSLLKALRPMSVPKRLVILGVGLGELVDAALTLFPNIAVVAWDRDPWMLRLLLSRRDFTADIRQGRLQLALGPDLTELSPEGARVVEHPALRSHYVHELHAWRAGGSGPYALLCSQALFANDLARELRQRGLVPWFIDVERVAAEELVDTVERLQPVVAVVVNQVVGLPEALNALDVPLLTWEVDPAVDRLPLPAGPVPPSHLFTFRRRHAAALRDSGHGSVTWLPLAAPPHRCPIAVTDEDRERFASVVSFVGSSMTGRARAYAQRVVQDVRAWLHVHGRPPAEAQGLVGTVLRRQRKAGDRWLLPELLDEICPGLQEWSERTGRPHEPAVLLGELPSSERRLRIVHSLASFGMRVWGDAGWKMVKAPGLQYRGFAGHHHDLTRIYQLSAINLDIGRLYQSDIVTMRVFDVMACGGFVIAQHSDELGDLFEVGVEVESWSTREELVDKVRHYLAHPQQAQEIAQRGRAVVEARHRVGHRVERMLDVAGIGMPLVQSE